MGPKSDTQLGVKARLLAGIAACLIAAPGAFAAASPVTDEMLAPLTSAYVRAVKPGEQADLHRELWATVVRRVERSHARQVDVPALIGVALKTLEPLEPQSGDPAEVFKKAMNAALGSLDPHSRYVDARTYTVQRSAIVGAFGGLGLQVEMADGLVRIVAPIPGTPAARAGLQKGDLIMSFDDRPVFGMALSDAIARIRGEAGSSVTLKIRRAGVDSELTLVREVIRTQAVRWSMEGDVLVLRLTRFTASVTAALEKAIEEATAAHTPRAVVLDMRGNGGGLLREAVATADLFLTEGEIVSLRGRTSGNRRTWLADARESLAGLPMVVLIDGRSASATELVAAALQDHGRATVMGQRSFGKGSVQSTINLGPEKGALYLTSALYHAPSGRAVQRTGVGPDIELVTAPPADGTPARRESDRAAALAGADEPLPPRVRVPQSSCPLPRKNLDPGLACALTFLKSGAVETFVTALEPQGSAAVH